MIVEYKVAGTTWVDVQSPDANELSLLCDNYDINRDIAQHLLQPLSDTKLITNDNQLYFSFHVTGAQSLDVKPRWIELDIIIIDEIIITVVYEPFAAIETLRKDLDVQETLGKDISLSINQLLASMTQRIHRDLRHILGAINNHQHRIEDRIFGGNERQMVRTISETGRLLFSLNQSIAEQRYIIKFLPDQFAASFAPFITYWQREIEHTAHQTKAQYELYHDLRRTNEELLATKQNEVMRKLTLVAFLTSPLTILAGIFGMNTRNVPFVGLEYDFWLILGVMLVVVLITMAALYRKGWFD